MKPMLPIPISAAKRIAEEYGYDQVIIIARRVGEDPQPHGEHCTTYGRDKAHCDVAASCGDFLKHKVMGWPRSDADQEPIPMILFCPSCGAQHVDAPDAAFGWTNPAHRSHLCHVCGCVWRPADVPTVGVSEIRTAGKADTGGRQILSHAGALAAIEAHVRSIEILSDTHGFDSVQWLAD